MGGDNQLRQERQQELEGALPRGRCNFVRVSVRMAGRWRQTRRRRGLVGMIYFLFLKMMLCGEGCDNVRML